MSKKMFKYMDVDVIAFLEEKMKGNTKHYQSDFALDKNILLRCASSKRPEDKTLLWMSRPSGTYCLREREVFIRDTSSHNTWRYYADQESNGIIAYAVELIGFKSGILHGNVYELDYLAHAADVAQKAVPCYEVAKEFEDGHVTQVALERSSYGYWSGLVEEHGRIVDSVAIPEDTHRLSSILAEEKVARNKLKAIDAPQKENPARAMLAFSLSPQDVVADQNLYTCCGDKEYTFLVRGIDVADAEKTGAAWYAKEVFEPGHFSCWKTEPSDINRLYTENILESREYLRQFPGEPDRKPSLDEQIQSANSKTAPVTSVGTIEKEEIR